MEENNKLGKKVAISVMSAALLGTSGYLIYDKGFNKAEKEAVKLASNTEEKKDERITDGNGLQSMFPNLISDPTKKDEKPGEKPNLNLADLIGNNKSPITPVTYNPNEVQIAKKDTDIKLSDAPTPPKVELPTNMGGPVVDPSKPVDPGTPDPPKPPVDPGTPDPSKPPVDPGTPDPPKPPVDPGTPDPPKPPVDPGTPDPPKPPVVPDPPKPPVVPDPPKPPVVPDPPKPPVDPTRPTITVSPKTGDILVEWYAGNNEYYSSVFFNDYYGSQKGQDSNALNYLTNNYDSTKNDWTLVSQLNTQSDAKKVAEDKLALNNLDKILENNDYSNHRELFYFRNQMNVLNGLGAEQKQQEMQKYLTENKKAYIQSVAEKVYQVAIKEEETWSNEGDTASLEQALSKYYLITSVFESVDPKLVEAANQRVEKIFYKLLEEELRNMDIQTPVVEETSKEAAKETGSNEETKTKEDNTTKTEAIEASSEQGTKEELMKGKTENEESKESKDTKEEKDNKGTSDQKKPEKPDPIHQVIEQIETYFTPENLQYENALLLANQWIDKAKGEQQEKLNQQFNIAVAGLQAQMNDPNVSATDALKKANLLAGAARVEKSVQDEAKQLLMPLMFEKKANEAAAKGEYYTAVLNIANAIRTHHPLERSREEMVSYANQLWESTESEWEKINGTTGWQSKVEKTVLPSYTLLAQLKDIDKTIGQISGMNVIDHASKKVEGIQLIQIASGEANKKGKLYDALHYYGQAASRGVIETKGFTNVANRVLKEAQQAEKTDYNGALKIYQRLYKTPGIEITGVKDQVKYAIDYLGTFDAANKKAKKGATIEDLASAIELTYQSMKLGYQQPRANQLMEDVSAEMFQDGVEYWKGKDINNAYKCFEFLTRDRYATTIDGTLRESAMKYVEQIKAMDAQK
ncbi:hypothetical protein [Bacillus pseudomycoides]|uniref:hypothetical protein n=1 Tax=Bacillus pseudomycoides TaxID=64104 RepID=UPI001FB1ECE0|nr:hypothetical protein [Bacillus pseudomycoides]